MAKMIEDILVIKVSKLCRDNQDEGALVSDDIKNTLEELVTELVGGNVLVEVEKA